MTNSILFVDDEPNILRSLERAFFDTDYDLYCANNANEALQILADTTIQLVVSDMRMPQTNGYDLFIEVKERHPQVVRVILSGYSDKEQLMRTVSDGVVRAYFYKPWENDELIEWVDSCFTLMHDSKLEQVEDAIHSLGLKLPEFSQNFYDFQQLFINGCKQDELVSVISSNSDYSELLIKTVRSAAFGCSGQSVEEAVAQIGVSVTKDIILHSEVIRSIKTLAPDGFDDELVEFDCHSSIINKVYHDLYQHVRKKPVPEQLEVVCLLHDIGRLLLFCCIPIAYREMEESITHESEIVPVEQKLWGIDHCVMGAYLAHKWSLPLVVQEICLYHHTPFVCSSQDRDLVAMISLADAIATNLTEESLAMDIDDLLAFFNITSTELDELRKQSGWDNLAAENHLDV